MKGSIYLLLGIYLGVCKSQYISINTNPMKLNPCDNLSSTAFVERFFDLIFTEFHKIPPACVCIQMCPDQATYCYPNGCLRRPERKVENANSMGTLEVNSEGTTKSATFAVDHKDIIVDDLLNEPALLTSSRDTINRPKTNDLILRTNPFKDLVLKYKRVPKLAMKYNLREQVRNTKSEKLNKEKNIDISKTRWPANKHLLHGKAPIKRMHHYKRNDDSRQTKFFFSVFPDNESTNYSPVFYKKYLTKRDNANRLNVEALYLYRTDTANFTLETLIDEIIENTLDRNKSDPILTLNVEVDAVNEKSTEPNINFTDIDFQLDEDHNTNLLTNNTAAVDIISIDFDTLNESIEEQKYLHDNNMTNQNIPDMIANMSKEIEIQNEVTLKFMERVTDTKSIISLNESTTNISVRESVPKTENATISPTTSPITDKYLTIGNLNAKDARPVPVTTASVYRKTKHRIMRKLKRRKIK